MHPAPSGDATMALLANLKAGPAPTQDPNMTTLGALDLEGCDQFLDVNMDDLLLPLLDDSGLNDYDYSLDSTPFVTPYNSEPNTPFDSPVLRSIDPGTLNMQMPPQFSLGGAAATGGFGGGFVTPDHRASTMQKLNANVLFQNLLLGGLVEQPQPPPPPPLQQQRQQQQQQQQPVYPQPGAHSVDIKPPPLALAEPQMLFNTMQQVPMPQTNTPFYGAPAFNKGKPGTLPLQPPPMPVNTLHMVVPPYGMPGPMQPRFSPYAPGFRRQVFFGEPVTETHDGRERNKFVHNVLERKRRKDLNDTFDLLATVLAASKNVPAKLCKREVITDTIEHVQYLKHVHASLHAQRENLTNENQQLVARLRELKSRQPL